MKSRTRRALSISETLMTMGIIGLLAVTMLSMNNFSDNKVKIAHTKLIQVDSAIRAWGKAVTQMNETGVGATAIVQNQNSLVNSVSDYLNTSTQTPINNNDATKITLDNGVELDVEYVLGKDKSFSIAGATQESTKSALATIKAESKVSKNGEKFSTEYVLLVDKLASLDDIYENFSKKEVQTITDSDGNTNNYICLNSSICGGENGCTNNPSACHLINVPEGEEVPEEIYVGNDTSSMACPSGQTGAIISYSFADNVGTVYSITSDECCDAPKYFTGKDEAGNKICSCIQSKMSFKSGEYFDSSSNTCVAKAPKGTYADGNGGFKLCMQDTDTGYYCDKEGLATPILCPVGYYCPKYEEEKNLDEDNYYKNSDDEIQAEGLIDKVECPAGYYCSTEGLTEPTPCPKGHYCEGGFALPVPCPKGTYQDEMGQTECKPCNSPEYQDEEGAMECKKCEGDGKFTNKEEKATMCTLCKADQYFDSETNACKTCDAPMTLNSTKTGCNCPDGTYKEDNYCVSNQKVYIVTAYKLADKHSSLTLGQNLSVFAGINAVNNWRYYGSSHHDVDKNNNEELKILLDKMTEELKNKVAYLGTAYIILEDGNLLTTAANYQIAYVNYSGWAYGSGNASADIENPNFEVINDLGMTNSNRRSTDKEEVSGGQIKYNNIVYNVAWTLFRKDTPLVLDLKGNGLKLTNVQNGVVFDLNGDGKADKTAWTDIQTEFDDAFLVFDKNSNGKIDNGKELFGDQNGASTGFEELAKYDDNKDGLITVNDTSFEKLQLWCDMNKNGITDNGELKSLTEAGITELSTSVTAQYDENGNLLEDKHGNTIGLVGYFKMLAEQVVDGVKTLVETVRTMIDVLFNTITL